MRAVYDMRSMCAQTDKVSSCPSQGFGQTRRLVVIIAKSVGAGGSLQQYRDMRRLRWTGSVVACTTLEWVSISLKISTWS